MPEAIRAMDRGDGSRGADTNVNRAPVAKTAAYTVLNADSGLTFTNRGAGGSITFTLPLPTTAGLKFRFMKATAAQTVVITSPTAGTMVALTTGVTITDSTSEGGCASLESDGTSWLVVAQTGTWAIS